MQKLAVYGVLPVLAFGAMTGVASAHGMGGMMGGGFGMGRAVDATTVTAQFQEAATVLGITVDQWKAYWAQGKTVRQVATELGISDATLQANMKTARDTAMKTQMQALVSAGVITQAQADARLAAMAAQHAAAGTATSSPRGGHRGGMMGMFGGR